MEVEHKYEYGEVMERGSAITTDGRTSVLEVAEKLREPEHLFGDKYAKNEYVYVVVDKPKREVVFQSGPATHPGTKREAKKEARGYSAGYSDASKPDDC